MPGYRQKNDVSQSTAGSGAGLHPEPAPSRSKRTVLAVAGQKTEPLEFDLIAEEPLSIRIQGNPYSVVMRTPGKEIALAAGFCLTEGIVDDPDQFATLAFCDGSDTNVVTVTVIAARERAIGDLLGRRGFVSQTSCGICGKTIIEDLHQILRPIETVATVDFESACNCLARLSDHQALREATRASHAAAIFDANLNRLATGEDVGRHNALDKAIGELFLDRRLGRAAVLVLSSRISYELVQKAARARIPIILAKSRPTALALDLAERLNMTMASALCPSGLYVYCGGQRLMRN